MKENEDSKKINEKEKHKEKAPKKINNKENIDNKEQKDLIVKHEKPFKDKKAKWLRQTSLTALLIVIIVAVCIGINIAVDNINIADFDFTKDKIYSLSDASKQIVQAVDKDVEIMLINMPDYEDFAKKYNSVNKNITVEVIDDLTSRTDLTDEYGITADSAIIIVKSGEKSKTLSSYDLVTMDYSTYQYKDIAEEALTNAIIDVTTDEKPIIYNLTGHNKYSSDYLYYFSADLEAEAYEFEDLNLLTTGSVPEDCSVLMITTLAEDITEAERDAILDYINKGGKIILFSDPNSIGKEMPNFQKSPR